MTLPAWAPFAPDRYRQRFNTIGRPSRDKGRVHGVGFRFVTERIALEAGLTGWVRNRPRGDVELVAEGAEEKLRSMLENIKASEVGRYIQKMAVDWQDYRNEFSDFRIEFVY